MGRFRLGFLGSQESPRALAPSTISAATKKRKNKELSEGTPRKNHRGTRPIITMLLHQGEAKHAIRVLLDTGCSIALINEKTVERLGLQKKEHRQPRVIESFTGARVPQAGRYYVEACRIQHRKHYSWEKLEISAMDPEINIFLPFDWITDHPPQGVWTNKEIRFDSPRCLEKCTERATNEFSLSWDETVLSDPAARTIGYVAALQEKAGERVPPEFRQFMGIMSKEAADTLPEHQQYDCKIDLKEGSTPPWGPIYPLSETELQALREWLREMEKNGKIQRSTSPAGSPILFVPKPNGKGLRLCMDYRGLNKITIPNRYPLPLMQELQDRVQGAQWFTKLDLKNGFNLIRIRQGDEWKTAFRTRYGLFEFKVMPFGLTNAPSTFQDMMNHVLSDVLDIGVLAYMDDILIYAKEEEEHDRLVKEVLKRLQDNGLAVSPEKCVWKEQEVEFLGYIIGRNGVRMSEGKIKAVLDWETPRSLKEVQSFLGFANFYRRFIQDYSRIARPLTELTKKEAGRNWEWNPEAEAAFQKLKQQFTTAPILAHFDATKPVLIETDASDFAIGAILSQRDTENRLHPIAFHSRKFTPAEINYEIHDKELLAIVDAFKHWRRYCEGAIHQVEVYSDHQNLEFFTTTKVLNRQQARWAQELAGTNFKIYYRPGAQKGKPDALSRRPEYRPEKGGIENQPITTVLGKKHFGGREGHSLVCAAARITSLPTRNWSEEFAADVRKEGVKDEAYNQARKQEAAAEELPPKDRKVRELSCVEGLLYRRNLLWVPEGLIQRVVESEHDTKVAGHMGQDKTIELIRRNFWWPKMNERIIDFVRSCPECQKNKAARHQPYGLTSPLELPYAPWQSIAMDFITELPLSGGCDQLWVVIDRFTKMAHFLPLRKEKKTAADLAVVFAKEIWRHHGLPMDIVSDRDSRFTSEIWREFLQSSGIRPRMSTAFHPQTDGQTERLNQTIEAYLRTFVSKEQDDWKRLLPMAEFAYNNSATTGNGMSPFYANYGFHPVAVGPALSEPFNPASATHGHWMHAVHDEARLGLQEARERMRRYTDPEQKAPPAYQVGDLVMLSGRHIKTRRPTKKLDHKNHGPFQIENIVSPLAIRLTLPRKWKIHNVFHVSLLEPYRTSEHRAPPDPSKVLREADDIEQSEEYDVDEVMASAEHGRGNRKRTLYLVKWLDFPERKDWTEEPFDNFSVGGLEKLREFHRRNPDAPRDYRLSE